MVTCLLICGKFAVWNMLTGARLLIAPHRDYGFGTNPIFPIAYARLPLPSRSSNVRLPWA
jgi:hypothetical protein